MKLNGIKRAITLISILMVALSVNAQKNSFSGSWILNTKKSEFGDIPTRAAVQFYQVKYDKSDMLIRWITNDVKSISISEVRVPMDSSYVSSLLPNKRTRIANLVITDQGKGVIFNKSYSKPGKAIEIDYSLKERWNLTNDGKELYIELTSPTYTIRAIYDRITDAEFNRSSL